MALSPISDVLSSSPRYRKGSSAPYLAPTPYLTPTATTATTPPGATAAPVDYTTLLNNDPILGQSRSNIAAAGIGNQAQLTAARRAALASYGSVPGNLTAAGNFGQDIDETTRQLAAQATSGGVSTIARLQRAYDLANQGDVANVAARGLLRSGATGQHLSDNLLGYNIAGYDAQQKLLDYLNGLWQGYQDQQQALQGQGVQAQADALSRLIEQIKAGLISGGGNGGGQTTAPAAPPISQPDYLTLPSRTSEPRTFPIGTIPQPGKAYAV